ncbi:hypothetical protein AgCh_000919 [Apium graveolens]
MKIESHQEEEKLKYTFKGFGSGTSKGTGQFKSNFSDDSTQASLKSQSTGFTAQPETSSSAEKKAERQKVYVSKEEFDSRRKCFKCQGKGHITSEYPSRRTLTMKQYMEWDAEEQFLQFLPEVTQEKLVNNDGDELAYAENDANLLVVRRILHTETTPNTDQRENLFHTRCKVGDRTCNMIIDSGSCTNVASIDMVNKLNLPTRVHEKQYKLNWLDDSKGLDVKKQALVSFSIGSYKDELWCDVIPMSVCHLLLGRPWQFDRKVMHEGDTNVYSVQVGSKRIKLQPLSPNEYYEHMRDSKKKTSLFLSGKEFEKEAATNGVITYCLTEDIRNAEQLHNVYSLIVPGAESTIMAKLAELNNLVSTLIYIMLTFHCWEFVVLGNLSLQQCEEVCLKSCNCTAYASADVNVGGRGCYAWFGELNDVKQYHYVDGQDFYLRLDAAELAANLMLKRKKSNKKRMRIIIIAVVVPVAFLFSCFSLYWWKNKGYNEESLETILISIANFSSPNKLGQEGQNVSVGIMPQSSYVTAQNLLHHSGQNFELVWASSMISSSGVGPIRQSEPANVYPVNPDLGNMVARVVGSTNAKEHSSRSHWNSKLTHLLQDSLGEDSKTLVLVQINPNENDLSETLRALNFASRVIGIELGPGKKQFDSTDLIRSSQLLENFAYFLVWFLLPMSNLFFLVVQGDSDPLLHDLLAEFGDVFPDELPTGLPPVRGIEHAIDLIPGAPLPNKPAYRCDPEASKEL